MPNQEIAYRPIARRRSH